ncbi:MAG: metallophosphoesterase [Elusimicrobia bacterium]|nr:metallophosphoesterase [Elusimicrobiota bacterium]
MTVVFAPAALLLAAGAASAQVVVPRALPSAPRVAALSSPVLSAPAIVDFPLAPSLLGTRVLGVPGPGVTPAHLEAAKALAVRTGEPVVIHGSRQTGFSHHNGLPFSPSAGLDLRVLGAPEGIPWDGRSPRASTIEDAVGRGHLVVAPAPVRLTRELESLRHQAREWRTDEQLTKLAASPRSVGETFRFAVIGDAEPGRFWFSRTLFNTPGVFWKLLARADRSGADFIFQLGDMVSRGTVLNFWSFVRGLFSVGPKTPYLTAIGNHDRHKPHGITNDRVYRAAFGSPDYAFDRGGRRFIVLDSSAGRVTPVQLAWLVGLLDPEVPTVVFTHIPPAPLSEWTDWGSMKGAGGFKEGSAEFMRLMSANKVQRVYMGHIHGLGVLERGGVKYVLTGGGGSPLYPGPVKTRLHHWLSVEAGPSGIVETVHAADGSSFPLR